MLIRILIGAGMMMAAPVMAQEASPGMSDAGRATVQESFRARDAELAPLKAKKADLQKQFESLLTSTGYDEQKLEATFEEMLSVEGAIVEKTGVTLLTLLKTLSEEDRATFLNGLKHSRSAPSAELPRRARPSGDSGR